MSRRLVNDPKENEKDRLQKDLLISVLMYLLLILLVASPLLFIGNYVHMSKSSDYNTAISTAGELSLSTTIDGIDELPVRDVLVYNTKSHPVLGGVWIIHFKTNGSSDLNIDGINTIFNKDIEFKGLFCGIERKETFSSEVLDGRIAGSFDKPLFSRVQMKNWTCTQDGYVVLREMTKGKHVFSLSFKNSTVFAENAAAGATQLSDFLYKNVKKFNFTTNHFNNSDTSADIEVSGLTKRTFYVSIPKRSTIDISNAEVTLSGGISAITRTTTNYITGIAGGNISVYPGKEIVVATSGELISYYNYLNWTRNWSISGQIADVVVGKTSNLVAGEQVFYGSQRNVTMVHGTNGTRIWTKKLGSNVVAVALANLNGDSLNDTVAVTSTMIYAFTANGTPLWNKSVAIDITDVSAGKLTNAYANDQIEIVSTTTQNATIFDALGNIRSNINAGYNLWSTAIGYINYSSSYETNMQGSADGDSLIKKLALGEVFPSNSNGEIVIGASSGSYGGHVVVLDFNRSELWDYDTGSGAITALAIADVTPDSGNEILVGNDNKEWFIQNHNYYPANVVFNISDIKRYNKSVGLFTGILPDLNISANLTHALANHCVTDLCNVSFILQATGTGLLRLSALFVRYEYDLSDRLKINTTSSFNTTRELVANQTYMFQHMNISFNKSIQDNLLFHYLEINFTATSCYFAGKFYPVATQGMTKFCNLTPDSYVVQANGQIPPSSYLWDNTFPKVKALYYLNKTRKNYVEWNMTYNLTSNSSRTLINSTLKINISDGNSTHRFNNETIFVTVSGTKYNITPPLADISCYTGSDAAYYVFNVAGKNYYVCMSDKDSDGYNDFVKIKVSSLAAYSKSNFTIHRYVNKFPYLVNSILKNNNIPWNRTQQFNVSFGDVELNNINVSLYVMPPGGQYQNRGSKLVAAGAYASFNVAIPSSWIGTVYYYYNFSDYSGSTKLHPWRTSPPLTFSVRKHYANLTVFSANNTNINRSLGSRTLVARILDLDNLSIVDGNTNGRLSVGGALYPPKKVNATGYVVYLFEPRSEASVGPNAWYFSVEDDRYFYNVSKSYIINIYGTFFVTNPEPTLSPPEGGIVSRKPAYVYPNVINWSYVRIDNDIADDMSGLVNISVFWKDQLRDSCFEATPCNRLNGNIIIPNNTPLFLSNDYVGIWINKSWYNPYHFLSSDYVVYENYDFIFLSPGNDTIVYRTSGFRNDEINFSMRIEKDGVPVEGASLTFATEIGNCSLVYNYTGGIYNCSFNPPDTTYPKKYKWWVVAHNGGPLGDDKSRNRTFNVYAVVNLSKMKPLNNSLLNATRNFIYCNITDFYLTKGSAGYKIANKTVTFYNGSRYIGSNKTNSSGISRITWDTSGVLVDKYFNVTCNITNETISNQKVNGNYQRLQQRYFIDYFEQLFTNNLLPSGSNVSRRYTSKYPSLINLTVNVTDELFTPILGATVSFNVSGDVYPPNCVGGVKEGTGGLYYCTYNPTDTLSPGLYSWRANASKISKKPSAKSSPTTILVKGFASLYFLNSSKVFNRTNNPTFKARVLNDANLSYTGSNFTCSWYIDGQIKNISGVNGTGYCSYRWMTNLTCAANVTAGIHNITVNLTNFDTRYYKQKQSDSGLVTLRDTDFNLTLVSPTPFQKLNKMSAYPLTVSVKDKCGYDLSTFTANWTVYNIKNGTSRLITVVSNQNTYFWTVTRTTYINSSQIIVNVTIPYTNSKKKLTLVDIYGWSKIFGANDYPDLNNYIEGDIVTLRCNVSDNNLNKSEYGYNITGHNVSFSVNGSYKFSNVSKNGIVLFHWNTLNEVFSDTMYNLTCTLNLDSKTFYNRTIPYVSSTLVHINALKPMTIALIGPINGTNVSRYESDHYRNHTVNLTAYVSSLGVPITNATVNWSTPGGICESTTNFNNGYYSCEYNPRNNLTPMKYNWTATATAYSMRPANTTQKRTLNIYGLLRGNSSNQYSLKENILSISARIMDENNKTNALLVGQRCNYYLNSILRGWDLDGDVDGMCWYNLDLRKNFGGCSYPVGNYSLNVSMISYLPYYDSSYRNSTYVLTIKDNNITISIQEPILNSVHMRNQVLVINSSINDSCGPILGHNTTWFDDGMSVATGDDTSWGIPISENLGLHNLTAQVKGQFYITKNTSRNYNVYAFSRVTFVEPLVANVSHDSDVIVRCYVQETDSNNRIVGYPVNLTENSAFVSTVATAATGNATFIWHPLIIGPRTIACNIWNHSTYVPSVFTSSRVITVIDTTAPTIRNASIKPLQGYINYMNFSLNATVYDLVNTTQVWFKINNTLRSFLVNLTKHHEINVTTDYYAKNYTMNTSGVYSVTAFAKDAAGNTRTKSLGTLNVVGVTSSNMTITPNISYNLTNLTRNYSYPILVEINITNIGMAPMFNSNLTLSVPKGFILNISNYAEYLNKTFSTNVSDFNKTSITRKNMTIHCLRIENGSRCRISLNMTVLANATPGNNSVLLFLKWKQPDNTIYVLQKNIRIIVGNNTVVKANTNLQNSLVSPGYSENVANFTLQAYGNTNLTNVTMKIIPSDLFPTLMNSNWFTYTPWKNKSRLSKLSDTKINVTINIPSSNYTYEVLNYHYPATSWTYLATLRINLTGNKNVCRTANNCYYDIPLHITVGASHWDVLDYDIVTNKKITKKVAYNLTDRLGYIQLFNYRTQAGGEINYTISKSGNVSGYLSFDRINDRVEIASSKNVPVYYSTNLTLGKFNGTIVFDADNSAITPNLLNVSISLEVLPLKVQMLDPVEESPIGNIHEDDIINITGRALFNSSSITDNLTFSFNISGVSAQIQSQTYNSSSGLWNFRVVAPHLVNNPIYAWIKFESIYNDTYAFDFQNNSLIYEDITPPNFTMPYVDFITPGQNATLQVIIKDNAKVNETYVDILFPNGNLTRFNLTKKLSDVYYLNLTNLSKGDYRVKFVAFDNHTINSNGTSNLSFRNEGSYDWWFGVYDKISLSGKINDRENRGKTGNIILFNPGTINETLFKVPVNPAGVYGAQIHKRLYAADVNLTSSMHVLVHLNNISFENSSRTTDFIDVDLVENLNGYKINSRKVYKILGFNSKVSSAGKISIGYSDVVVDDFTKMYIFSCSSWNFAGQNCSGTWTKIDSRQLLSLYGDTYIQSQMTFGLNSAFALVDDTPPVEQQVDTRTNSNTNTINPDELRIALEKKLNESRQKILNETKSIIDPFTERLSSFSDFNKKYGLNLEDIQRIVYQGENLSLSLYLKNSENIVKHVRIDVSDNIKNVFRISRAEFDLLPNSFIGTDFSLFASKDFRPGLYSGYISITIGDDSIVIPVNIRVMEPDALRVQMNVDMVDNRISLGKGLGLNLDLYNPAGDEKTILVTFEVYDMNQNLKFVTNKTFILKTYLNTVATFDLPKDLALGEYYVKTKVSYEENGYTREFSKVTRFNVVLPLLQRTIFGIPAWYILFALALAGLIYAGVTVRDKYAFSKRRYRLPVLFKEIPLLKSRDKIFLGKLSEYDKEVYFDTDNLSTHTIVAGSTGGGKTVAAQGIVEEALNKKIGVVVFDPTAQWTGFFRKNTDKKMFQFYGKFGMKPSDSKSYSGKILVIDDPLEKINLERHLVPGEITVFSLHKLNPKEIDLFVASTVKQVFGLGLDESSSLKYLLVYDEVHRLLPKFGGTGAGFIQIERAAREFRKWGLGLVLISQVLSDFIGEIKANINTEIQLRTKDEGDLERLKSKYGDDVLKSVVKAETGNGMLVNPSYNKGKPFMVNFKPLLHSPHRLTETELAKYVKYSEEIDEINYNVDLMKSRSLDVFDLELELKLAKEKLSSGSFTMVEIYLEGLNSRLSDTLSKNKMTRQKVVLEKVDVDELKEDIRLAEETR